MRGANDFVVVLTFELLLSYWVWSCHVALPKWANPLLVSTADESMDCLNQRFRCDPCENSMTKWTIEHSMKWFRNELNWWHLPWWVHKWNLLPMNQRERLLGVACFYLFSVLWCHPKQCWQDNTPSMPWTRKLCKRTWMRQRPLSTTQVAGMPAI